MTAVMERDWIAWHDPTLTPAERDAHAVLSEHWAHPCPDCAEWGCSRYLAARQVVLSVATPADVGANG